MIKTTQSIVLIPGFMLNDSLWDAFITELPNNWNIISANLSAGDTIPEIAQNISQVSPEQFILIGFSLGGYIARSLAEQFPDKVSKLILIASSSRPDTLEQRKQKLAALKLSKNSFRGLSSISIAKTLHPSHATDALLIKKIQKMGKELGYEALVKQSLLDREIHHLNKILCPTLIITGEQDAIRSEEEANEMLIQLKKADLEMIADTGHMTPIEQPKRLAETVLKWLGNQSI